MRAVDELTARAAARLRTDTGRAATISAVDAIVAAFAEEGADAWYRPGAAARFLGHVASVLSDLRRALL